MSALRITFKMIAGAWLACFTGGAVMGQSMPAEEKSNGPTYTGDIAPIIERNCLDCHGSGGAAPFELATYADVRKRATLVARLTASKRMPPWLAGPQPDHLRFLDERGLTDEQIELIQKWVEGGCLMGDAEFQVSPPAASPAGPDETAEAAWRLGVPDRVLTLAQPYESPAEGTDVLVSFVLPTGLERDGILRAIEFKPGNPRLIHHASFLADSTGVARDLANASGSGSFLGMGSLGLNPAGSLGVWSPGASPHELPAGVGRKLSAGSDIVVEVHFSPTGKVEPFTFSLGVYLDDEKGSNEEAQGEAGEEPIVEREAIVEATTITLGSFLIDIPAGEAGKAVEDVFTLPVDARVLSLTPHAHNVCSAIEVSAAMPGSEQPVTMLAIPRWNFDWMTEFAYRKPVTLPAGTTLKVRFVYDNSAANPRNPHDPPQRVKAGHRVSDEMALVLVNLAPVHAGEEQFLEEAHRQAVGRRIAMRDAAREADGSGEQRPQAVSPPTPQPAGGGE